MSGPESIHPIVALLLIFIVCALITSLGALVAWSITKLWPR